MKHVRSSPGHLLVLAIIGLPLVLTSCGDDGTPGRTVDTDSGSADADTSDTESGMAEIVCIPGEVRCSGQHFLERCVATGREWLSEECGANAVCQPCGADETCASDRCVGPCDVEEELPSSAGCSFIANRQLHLDETLPDGLIVANPNVELVATVQLYEIPEGKRKEEPLGLPIVLGPLELYAWDVYNEFVAGSESMFRTGGMLRVESDIPIIAYQHAPRPKTRGNDSSLLIPESALGRDYVVQSFSPHYAQQQGQGIPSYFEIIALSDQTRVEWSPLYAPTGGNGLPVPPVKVGEKGAQGMNRFDTMRVAAGRNWISEGECEFYDPDSPGDPNNNIDACYNLADVSGTVITADKPIWVVGAVRCARVPVRSRDVQRVGGCDPLQELLLPIDYWGRRYVAAHSPVRENESHHWRIFAGDEGVTVTTVPSQPGTPYTFDRRGEYIDVSVPNSTSFIVEADGPVMPVQYLQSHHVGNEPLEDSTPDGDPSMYQMIPVEQFLSRYVVATSINFDLNYIQVIRRLGESDVLIDGEAIAGYYPVGEFEVADVLVDEGVHVVESDEPIGVVQVGYTIGTSLENCVNDVDSEPHQVPACYSSYAHPGGMRRERIFIP